MSQVTEAEIKAIIDGCEGVTPGPWLVAKSGTMLNVQNSPFGLSIICRVGRRSKAEAQYLARLSPEVVRSLLTELLELRSRAPLIDPAGGGEGKAVAHETIEAIAAATRSITFSALTMDEHRDLVRGIAGRLSALTLPIASESEKLIEAAHD